VLVNFNAAWWNKLKKNNPIFNYAKIILKNKFLNLNYCLLNELSTNNVSRKIILAGESSNKNTIIVGNAEHTNIAGSTVLEMYK